MSNMQCPLCGKEAELMKVAEEWLLKEIAKEHPEWVESDGACEPCITYYRGLHDPVSTLTDD